MVAAVPDRTVTQRVWVPYAAARVAVPEVPGTPGRPASTTTDLRLGWNAGAVSIQTHDGNFTFSLSVNPSAVGIVAGLNHQNLGSGYVEIGYGFYFTSGKALVYENGVAKNFAVTFTAWDEFKITRVSGVVTYHKNGTLLYTSTVPSSGVLFADT